MADELKEPPSILNSLPAAGRNKPVSWGAFAGLLDQLCRHMIPAIRSMQDRIAELESRGVKFCGVYQRACDYERGDCVTCDGAAWVALKDVPSGVKPGGDEAAQFWQLWQKSPT